MKVIFKNNIWVIALFWVFQYPISYAQNFEWLQSYESKGVNLRTVGICQQADSNIISLIAVNETLTTDSVYFGKFGFRTEPFKNYNFLVTNDASGEVRNVREIGDFFAHGLCSDNEGNLYVLGYSKDTSHFDQFTALRAYGGILFIMYDKNQDYSWHIQTGNDFQYMVDANSNTYSSGAQIICSSGKILFIVTANKSVKIGDSSYVLNGARNYIIGEINKIQRKIKWSKCFLDDTIGYMQITSILNINGSVFISGDFSTTITKSFIIIYGDTIFCPGAFIIKADSVGTVLKIWQWYNGQPVSLRGLTTNGVSLFFGGFTKDTILWFGKKIPPKYPSNQGWAPWYEFYMASLSTDFKAAWFYKPNIISTSVLGQSRIITSTYQNGFIYSLGLNTNTKFKVLDKVFGEYSTAGFNDIFVIKFDPIGQVLWTTDGRTKSSSLGYLQKFDKNSVALGSSFIDSVKLGVHLTTAKGKSYNSFLTKITDYDITRGPVKAGPYCAGDTILVPYTHVGTFDSSNWFIAELSDEYGNFDGDHRELGRLKTNLDSVVPGVLPLFSVASSGAYRIRVRSTAPAIQSYYILDSLRLLIYSRDKADPGPPDTICYRDTFMLKTFGGTRWTWSPAWLMDDSTLRTPRVWPDRDTSYRIIIADSSGCGMSDTAFKFIAVKSKPRLAGDTLLYKCPGDFLKIKLNTLFADSGHLIKWYRNNRYFFTGDSMLFAEDADVKLMAVLFDFCSPANDTFFVQVVLNTQAKLMPTADTAVCYGSAVAPAASASGGYKHVFRWFSHNDSFLGFNPVVRVWQPDSFKVVLGDACSDHADSTWMKVTLNNRIYPGAKLLPNDTFFCSNFSYILLPLQWNNADSVRWFNPASNFTLSLAGQFTLNRPDTLAVAVTNLCGISYDTLVVNQYRKPVLTVDSLYQPCNGSVLQLTAGEPQPATSYRWFNADTSRSVSIAQSGSYSVVAKNNCGTDSAAFSVQYISKPTAAFGNADVCEGQWFVFNNLSKGANSFFWRLGDGTVSSDSAPLHQYPTTGQARTFLVSLKAFASADCADSITLPVNVKVTPKPDFIWHAQGKALFFTPLVAGNAYKWFFGDGDSSALDKPVHSYTADSGSYNVCLSVTNAEGCLQTTCKQVYFNVSVSTLQKNGFVLFPNPTDGAVHIRFKESGHYQIEISDMLGRVVYVLEVSGMEHTLQLPMRGTYFIKINGDGWQEMEKLVVW